MAAFDTTITQIKTPQGEALVHINSVYTRTFSYTIPASTVAASTAVIADLPAGTFVIGILQKASATLGSTTLAYSTTTGSVGIVSAATLTSTTAVPATIAAGYCGALADTITVTTGAATSPATATTVTVTLILASVAI